MRTIIEIYSFSINLKSSELVHKPLALDGRVVQKISNFQNIKYFFHGVTQIGVKPQQNLIQQIQIIEEFKVFAY